MSEEKSDRSPTRGHGNLSGGPLHTVATSSSAGFMSVFDKINLDTLASVYGVSGGQATILDRNLVLRSNSDFTPQVNLTHGGNTAGSAPYFISSRARGTYTSPTAVASGDTLGNMFFFGYDGAAYQQAAYINAVVDGTPGAGDMPTRLVFGTTPDGGATTFERMRIDNGGNVGIGNTPANATLGGFSGKVTVDGVGSFYNQANNYRSPMSLSSSSFVTNLALPLYAGGGSVRAICVAYNTSQLEFNRASNASGTGGVTTDMVIDGSGNVTVGSESINTLRYLDVLNPNTGASAGSIIRLITSNVAGSGNTTVDIVKYKNGLFVINNNETNAAAATAFNVAGSERMRIDNAGNVGIGTTTPANKFEVFGNENRSTARASTTAGRAWLEAQASDYWSLPSFTGTSIQQYGSTATGTTAGISNVNLGQLLFQNVTTALISTNGSAPIVFASLGAERMRITNAGDVIVTSPGTLGYGVGSGGSIPQTANKNTNVTLNRSSGQITMNASALGAGAVAEFSVLNSNVGANDNVFVSGVWGFSASYRIELKGVFAGGFAIRVTNITAGSLSEALVLNFAVIKGSTS